MAISNEEAIEHAKKIKEYIGQELKDELITIPYSNFLRVVKIKLVMLINYIEKRAKNHK